MPKRNLKSQRTEYSIGGINDKTKSVLTLLATTDSENFSTRRKEIIFTQLNLEHPDSRAKAITSYLSRLRVVVPDKIKEDLIDKKITPYEAVGLIKDKKEFKTKPSLRYKKGNWGKNEMRDTWTMLSIIDGLNAMDPNLTYPHMDNKITEESIKPNLENLALSLDSPAPNKSKKYKENFPHLRASHGKETNWGEILNGVNNRSASLIRNLLESSKDNINKEKITKEYLWPTQSKKQIENRKLLTIINKVGNRPTGRKRRYEKIIRGLEDELKMENLPEVEPTLPSRKEIKLSQGIVEALEKTLAGKGDMDDIANQINRNGIWERSKRDTKRKDLSAIETALLTGFNALLYLRGINTKEAKEGWEKFKPYYDNWKKKFSPPKLALLKIFQKQTIDQERLIATLLGEKLSSELLERVHPSLKDSQTYKYLGGFDNIGEFKDRILASKLLSQSNVIKQALHKKLTISKPEKETRLWDLLEHLLNGKPLDLEKGYGRYNLTMLHISAIVGSKEETAALCQAYQKENLSLNLESLESYTPLHISNAANSKALLSHGADPNMTSDCGKKPEEWRSKIYFDPKDQKEKDNYIKSYRFKKKFVKTEKEENINL
jgi:hypothetical protein